jgi:hypothetical protein
LIDLNVSITDVCSVFLLATTTWTRDLYVLSDLLKKRKGWRVESIISAKFCSERQYLGESSAAIIYFPNGVMNYINVATGW